MARVVPSMARSLLALAAERGVSHELLCRGLGFSYESLHDGSARMSYQQVRGLILRSLQVFKDPTVGLAVGTRQTPVSWGLPGLLMQTCETFGEAVLLGMTHQDVAGALVHHLLQDSEDAVVVALVPQVPDLPVEQFLIESSMAAMVAVFRVLMHSQRSPEWVELAFARPAYSQAYQDFFRCPVRFNADAHRMAFDPTMLVDRVPGYDPISCGAVRAQLLGLLVQPVARHELVETLTSSLRISVDAPPRQQKLAQAVNVSDRTLRRRLNQQDTSFSTLRDGARYDQARELLTHSNQTVAQVAETLGYSDARAFRRAFKRWSGQLPTAFREATAQGE
jgi:AraC-like DNA-binding protein